MKKCFLFLIIFSSVLISASQNKQPKLGLGSGDSEWVVIQEGLQGGKPPPEMFESLLFCSDKDLSASRKKEQALQEAALAAFSAEVRRKQNVQMVKDALNFVPSVGATLFGKLMGNN